MVCCVTGSRLHLLLFVVQVVCRDLLLVAALQRYSRDQGSSVYFPQAVLRGEAAPRHSNGGSEGPNCVCALVRVRPGPL